MGLKHEPSIAISEAGEYHKVSGVTRHGRRLQENKAAVFTTYSTKKQLPKVITSVDTCFRCSPIRPNVHFVISNPILWEIDEKHNRK